MSKVTAISMMKDEDDVAYHVVEHLASERVDHIIVADNRSTDGTRDELERAQRELDVHITILADPEVGYYQSRKMTALAQFAADAGAEWIVPFDADEIWYTTDRDWYLGDLLRSQHPEVGVLEATLWNHFATALDDDDPNPFRRMQWKHPDAGGLTKVAFRWNDQAVIHQGNHGVDGVPGMRCSGSIGIRHFPYRNFPHFIRKARNGAAAYQATDLGAAEGAHWRQYGDLIDRYGEGALREVYDTYFWALAPVNEGWLLDPAPIR